MSKPTPKAEAPAVVSLSLVREGEGWSVATITTQGDRVVSVEKTVPDVRMIAVETFKTAAARLFLR